LRSAYARSVEPSEHQPGTRPGTRRRTPVRVPGEVETAEVSAVGPATQDFELPDIVSAGPPTAATPLVAPASEEIETRDLPATEPMEAAEPRGVTVPRISREVVARRPLRRQRVRKVTRVVRHIDPWSAFKVGIVFSLAAYIVGLTAGVLLWRVADSTGTLGNIERWFTQFGWETFELKGDEVFAAARTIGLFLAVALTGLIVLLATLFNLVSDVVGGLRVSVLEEESIT
jgi:hypothetical protein